MPTNERLPIMEPATRPTGRCTAAVRIARFVALSATIPGGSKGTENLRIAEAGAGAHAVAVSCQAGAINEEINLVRGSAWMLVASGAALVAGTAVQSDAQGRAIPLAAGAKLGVVTEDAAGADIEVGVLLDL